MRAGQTALTRHLDCPAHGLAHRQRRLAFEEIATMKSLMTLSAVAAVVFFAAAQDANAWTRNGSATGWRGTATVNAAGSCAGGTCSRSVTRTGPYGNSMSRQGSVSCANGACTGSRTTTGPRGNTVYRQGSVSR
jgi:hypothetical protein